MAKSLTEGATLIGLGAGGHARVMIHTARCCGWEVRLLVDQPRDGGPQELDGVPIRYVDDSAFLSSLSEQARREPVSLFMGVTGQSAARATAFQRVVEAGLPAPTLIHPSALVESEVSFGMGVHVLAGATIGAGATLGCDVLINHRSVVEHDCVVGDHVHLATGAVLCGGVTIESGCMIGAGAVVLPGIRVRSGSVVGAGAIVTKDVAEAAIVAGNPARPIGESCSANPAITHPPPSDVPVADVRVADVNSVPS